VGKEAGGIRGSDIGFLQEALEAAVNNTSGSFMPTDTARKYYKRPCDAILIQVNRLPPWRH
jgi:hypothetical protein